MWFSGFCEGEIVEVIEWWEALTVFLTGPTTSDMGEIGTLEYSYYSLISVVFSPKVVLPTLTELWLAGLSVGSSAAWLPKLDLSTLSVLVDIELACIPCI